MGRVTARQNDVHVTPDIRNEVREELRDLARNPDSPRSLTSFRMSKVSDAVKSGLEAYTNTILDGDHDELALSCFTVFEMDELYRLDKKIMNGALSYIFHRIRRRLRSDVPTLVTVDEFREALSHPMAAKFFDEFLLEGRKLNCAVWMAVQELGQILNSPLKNTILNQCFTKVCLPNAQAISSAASAYELLDLTADDRQIIAESTPKSDYYIASPDAKRLISLDLHPLTLAFVGASSDSDRETVDELIARYGDRWPAEWLRMRGLAGWADELDTLQQKESNYAIA
jgi:type IV secretion system protein TrbE